MSPLNRGPLMGPRMPPVGMRPPPPRFGRPPMPGMPRLPPPPMPMGGMFGPMRQRMPPPRPGPMMRPGGPPPLFGPRARGPPPLMLPMMGPRGIGPRGPPMRPGPRGMLPPQVLPHMRARFPINNGNIRGKHMNNGKKSGKKEELEMKKPWMTDEIRSEIQKKNKFYAKAKKNNKIAKEWGEFKDLRNKVTRMIRDAKHDYFAKNPDQAALYQDDEEYCDNRDENYASEDEEDISYYCEMCDRDFFTQPQLDNHMKEHQVCGIDGCTFSAHTKIVEKHITMQHCTGLYDRMKNLKTPEDIEKWIAERKKKYPTKSNIDQQNAANAEKNERGEIIKKTNKLTSPMGGENKRKPAREKKTRRGKKRRPNVKERTPEVEKDNEMYRGILPFKGTKSLMEEFEKETTASDEAREENCFLPEKISDDEDERLINTEPVVEADKTCPQNEEVVISPVNPILQVSSLSSLVADYGSDTDDEPPEEIPIKKAKIEDNELAEEISKPEKTNDKKVSSKKVESKQRKNSKMEKKKMPIDREIQKTRTPRPQLKRHMLLNKLLSRSIQHERNAICQCIKYIVDNNFFDQQKT